MAVLTSAKSKLMIPGLVIKSEIPETPCNKTSSTILKASMIGAFLSTICSKLLLAITINVSTFSFNLAKPSAADLPRFGPSNENGRVTTPIVKAPESLAILAITGAAPVPVPPPIPAVTKTMSAPARASAISCSLSLAAASPTSGRAPAPKPRVALAPI